MSFVLVPKNYRVPKFVEDLKAVLTKEGLVSFECKVVGFPTPVLRYVFLFAMFYESIFMTL